MARRDECNYDGALSQWLSIPAPPDVLDQKGACRRLRETNPTVAEYFFLDYPSRTKDAEAKKFCARCPVRRECLAYALAIPAATDFGIWGGTNRNQRRELRKG